MNFRGKLAVSFTGSLKTYRMHVRHILLHLRGSNSLLVSCRLAICNLGHNPPTTTGTTREAKQKKSGTLLFFETKHNYKDHHHHKHQIHKLSLHWKNNVWDISEKTKPKNSISELSRLKQALPVALDGSF